MARVPRATLRGRGAAPSPLVLLCGVACACTVGLVSGARIDPENLGPVQDRLTAIRGLSFSRPLARVQVPLDEAQARRAAELETEQTSAELDLLSAVYARLGLVPADTDLRRIALRLHRDDPTDYYDPHRDELVLVAGQAPTGLRARALEAVLGRRVQREALLAHELTLALHDEHFGVSTSIPPIGADDQALAARAVLEGDAILTTFAYTGGSLESNRLALLAEGAAATSIDAARLDPALPPAVRDVVVFPYTAGTAFVARALRAHGWAGVDALLAHPPRSTEQVLHPERYYSQTDDPQAVQLPELTALGPILGEWTLGELRIRGLCARVMPPDEAQRVAEGWDGDRLRALEAEGGLGVVWLSVWDDAGAAAGFFDAYRTLLAAKYPEAPPSRGTGGLESPPAAPIPYILQHRDQRVLVIEGLPRDSLTAAAAAIWEGTIIVPQGPALPWLDLVAPQLPVRRSPAAIAATRSPSLARVTAP